MLIQLPQQLPLKRGLLPEQHPQLRHHRHLQHTQIHIPHLFLIQIHLNQINHLLKLDQLVGQVQKFDVFLDYHFVGSLQVGKVETGFLWMGVDLLDLLVGLVGGVGVEGYVAVF